MDKIILLILFTIFGSVTKGNAQRHCFVCTNCPNGNELDANLIENCEAADDPDITTDPVITTTEPAITITDPEDTTITSETDPIITQTTPDEPPTTTPQIPDDTTTTQTTDDGGITTPTLPIIPPTTTPQIPVSPSELPGHKYRHIMRQLVGEYQCFVVHQQVGNAVQVNRGCVLIRETEQQTCFDANSGAAPESCRLCSYDECNTASKYAVSLVVVLSSLFVVLAIR